MVEEDIDNPHDIELAMRVCYDLGQVQRAQGSLDAALATYRQALEVTGETSQTAHAGMAHVGLAQVLYERNERHGRSCSATSQGDEMPLINVKLIEDVFTPEQKRRIVEDLTDAMVAIEGENMRQVTWVVVEEVRSGDWGIAGAAVPHRRLAQPGNACRRAVRGASRYAWVPARAAAGVGGPLALGHEVGKPSLVAEDQGPGGGPVRAAGRPSGTSRASYRIRHGALPGSSGTWRTSPAQRQALGVLDVIRQRGPGHEGDRAVGRDRQPGGGTPG